MNEILAIARKDLRTLLVSPIVVIAVAVVLAAMGFHLNSLLEEARLDVVRPASGAGCADSLATVVERLLGRIGTLLLFLAPLSAAGSLANERRRGTIELFFGAQVSDLRVFLGKFSALFAFFAALITPALLGLVVVAMASTPVPSAGRLVVPFLGLLLLIATTTSWGIFLSSLTKSRTVAALSALGLSSFFWFLEAWVPPTSMFWAEILRYFSILSRYQDFLEGTLDSRNLVFFASAAALAYFLTRLSLNLGRFGPSFLKPSQRARLVVVIGVLVSVNVLSDGHPGRIDVTWGQINTLSAKSSEVLRSLEDNIEVTAFFAEATEYAHARELTERLLRHSRDVNDAFHYAIVDPARLAESAPTGTDREGLALIRSNGRFETIDLLGAGGWRPDNEERLVRALIRVSSEERKRIYFLEGHGERDLGDRREQGFSRLAEGLRKQRFQVESWNLADSGRLPDPCDVLVSAAPQVNFQAREIDLINAFLEGGGRFLLLVDPQTDFSMNEGFLAPYGLSLGDDLVLEAIGGRISSTPSVGHYPRHPITREVSGARTLYPQAQSLLLSRSLLGYETAEVVASPPRCWAEADPDADEVGFDAERDRPGPFPLAAAASKNAPDRESRLVVFGDSDFATNAYFNRGGNGELLLNSVNWLAGELPDLGIPPRAETRRSILLGGLQARLLWWIPCFVLPLSALLAATLVWRSRSPKIRAATGNSAGTTFHEVVKYLAKR